MQYSVFKYSPTSGDRIYSSTEVADKYGISANLLNKVLLKIGFLKATSVDGTNQKFTVVNPEYGEVLYWNEKKYGYVTEPSDVASNTTVKFTEVGKTYIDTVISALFPTLHVKAPNYDGIEPYFPDGKFSLSIRFPGTKFNSKADAKPKIYVSYRTSKDPDDHFNQYYLNIDDNTAKLIQMDMRAWRHARHEKITKKNFYWIELDDSPQAQKIFQWMSDYFNDICKQANIQTSLTKEEKQHNRKVFTEYLEV